MDSVGGRFVINMHASSKLPSRRRAFLTQRHLRSSQVMPFKFRTLEIPPVTSILLSSYLHDMEAYLAFRPGDDLLGRYGYVCNLVYTDHNNIDILRCDLASVLVAYIDITRSIALHTKEI